MGHVNASGVYEYDEDDDEASFSDLLNLGQHAERDGKAFFRGPAVNRAALDPAPAGAYWKDTDGPERLWSAGPDGNWRLHEGVHQVPGVTMTAAGALYVRDYAIELPTILADTETLAFSAAPNPAVNGYFFVPSGLVRGPASTSVNVRQVSYTAAAQTLVLAWRVTGGA